jgi:2-aminoadipate transaminase
VEAVSFAGEGLAPELLPADELADCAATALGADGGRILSYGTGFGYTPLRELIAEQLGVHPYRVLLTNGWLQGFRMLLRGRAMGQNVICEYPTYDRALESIFQARANLLYLDLHPGGFADDQLEYIVRTSQKAALAYTNPTFHNPTGESLSEDKRLTLGEWLHNRARVPIVEDDSYGLLRFEGEPLRTMFELSRQSIVYSTSFSATIAPGLRVGVFVLTDELATELAAIANSIYIAPVLLAQATVYEFLQRGSFEPHLAWLNQRLAERRDAVIASLERHFPDAEWSRPEGGLYVLLRLPPGTNAARVLERADGVSAGAATDYGGLPPNAIRLNYAAPASAAEIEPGIERLAASYALPLEPEPDS